MIFGLIIGLFVGAGFGILAMALMVAAKDADDQHWDNFDDDEKELDIHHICDDCRHGKKSGFDEPCRSCIGDKYSPKRNL